MEYAVASLAVAVLVAAVAIGWTLTLLGMPGNWLMVVAAALFAWLGPAEGVMQLGWRAVAALAVLAAGGEIAEFATGVWGARRAGGSRRAALFALLGSFVGALVGAALGMPIPILGSPLAAIFGGAAGALVGAAFGEHTRGEAPRQSLRVGNAAFWGRLLGSAAKAIVATVIALAIFVSLFF